MLSPPAKTLTHDVHQGVIPHLVQSCQFQVHSLEIQKGKKKITFTYKNIAKTSDYGELPFFCCEREPDLSDYLLKPEATSSVVRLTCICLLVISKFKVTSHFHCPIGQISHLLTAFNNSGSVEYSMLSLKLLTTSKGEKQILSFTDKG